MSNILARTHQVSGNFYCLKSERVLWFGCEENGYIFKPSKTKLKVRIKLLKTIEGLNQKLIGRLEIKV